LFGREFDSPRLHITRNFDCGFKLKNPTSSLDWIFLFEDVCLAEAVKLHLQFWNNRDERSYSPRLHLILLRFLNEAGFFFFRFDIKRRTASGSQVFFIGYKLKYAFKIIRSTT
jgi:hypothetical protein